MNDRKYMPDNDNKYRFKILFIILGCITTVLGFMGIFVPGLPATPLLLLSSWLFYRSSKKLHDALHRSFLGNKIREYVVAKDANSFFIAFKAFLSIFVLF